MDLEWVERIRRQCDTQGVAFFFKQHGGTSPDKGGSLLHGREHKQWPIRLVA
jgi:protein gp37